MARIAARYPRLWISSLFLLLPWLAFPEIIFGRQTLYRTDISWIHYPGHIFMAEEWLAGRVPLWDPYRQAGAPMLAEPQIGVLYPLRALILSPLPPSFELSLFILIHFTLAACFTFVLARSLAMRRPAATLAGLVFGLGGFLMAQTSNVNILTGAAWLPLILYALMRATRRRSWLAAMLTGLPLALQIFTAHSQIVFYTLVVMAGYGLWAIVTDFFFGPDLSRWNVRRALQTGLLVTVAIASGLLLGAPQLLPSLELVQLTVRSLKRGLDLLTENSLPPLMWLNLVLPSAFGNNVVGFKGGDPFQEDFIYAGFMPLLLAFFSWRRRRERPVLFFGLLLFGSIILAMGRFTPLYAAVIQYLPGFDLFRIPARWLMVVNLALAMLAGFGLEALLARGLSRSTLIFLLSIGLLVVAGLILMELFQAGLLAWSSRFEQPYRKLAEAFLTNGLRPNPIYQDRLLLRWLIGLSAPAYLLLTNIIITAGLLSLLVTRRISPPSFALLTVVAVSVDLTLAGGTTINPIRPDDWWQRLSGGAQYVLEHIGQARVFPLGVSEEEAAVSHLGQYFPSAYRVHSAGGYASPLRLARYETFLDEAHPVQGLQVLGVRYLLTLGQMGADVAATFPLVYHDEYSYVYENKNPLPRTFIVYQAIRADSPAEALDYFRGRALDPRRTVILESEAGPPPPLLPASPAQTGTAEPASTAAIISENPQELTIQANLIDDGYLILLDTYYPGWIVSVDGQRRPIYRADYIGRAVFLAQGRHLIHFAYRPLSFKLGLGLALLMGLVLAATKLSAPIALKCLVHGLD